MNYEALFAHPGGRLSRGAFLGGLATLLAALAFYHFLVFGASGRLGMLVMLYPAAVLHARRLHDMGQSGWLLLVPAALLAAAVWLRVVGAEAPVRSAADIAAALALAAFALWGAVGKGRNEGYPDR